MTLDVPHDWSIEGPFAPTHPGASADSSTATVIIRTRVENDHANARRGLLRSFVLDSRGMEVARSDTAMSLDAAQHREIEQRVSVARPQLWSRESPAMYTLRQIVIDGSRPVDDVTTPFGIRTIALDKDRGTPIPVLR